ncbi:hypothetical protein ARTHRO_41142 [Limnospira indica PCC 8005]|uniref:Uncharacterized protein n=1 Tax=Limnospira indica PCC 8005 TaxID=376219 RepID=A0A9P1P244_9CYAN|nr:hypothetical protein ARTHRO_41142 [Limnospira indica PCC 8005]
MSYISIFYGLSSKLKLIYELLSKFMPFLYKKSYNKQISRVRQIGIVMMGNGIIDF